MRLITEIKSKPESVRKRWAFGFALLGGLIVLVIWVVVLMHSIQPQETEIEAEATATRAEGPWMVIKNSFGEVTDQIGEGFAGLRESFRSQQ